MSGFCIRLAGIPIEVHAAYASTEAFCREYLTEEAPLFSVTLTQAYIEKMRMLERKARAAEEHPAAALSESYLETWAFAMAVLDRLVEYNVLMCHGAVMAFNGKAYLFTAKSGTGKSTHCGLWLRHIPGCHILNGDKPLLLFRNGRVYACGSPWQGKENYGVNEILPLEAICILTRDETNHIEKIALRDCFETLAGQFHIPDGRGAAFAAFKLISQLSSLGLYRLGCNMEPEAAMVSCKGMTGASFDGE